MLTQCVSQHRARGWASHTVACLVVCVHVCVCVWGGGGTMFCSVCPIPENRAEGRTAPYSVHMFVPDLDSSVTVTNSINGPSVTRTA
jgi:hypothetical protein